MMYLWGQGRISNGLDSLEFSGDGVGVGTRRGVVVVGAVEIWWLISCGTESGVTLSMKVKAGKRSMVVGRDGGGSELWSEGRGMLEADSMSFYISPSAITLAELVGKDAHPITRLNLAVPHSLHHAPLLIANIFHPIRLTRGDDHVRRPAVDMPIELFLFINLEAFWVLDLAGRAVVSAIFAVDCRVNFWKDKTLRLGERVCGCFGCEESFAFGDSGLQ